MADLFNGLSFSHLDFNSLMINLYNEDCLPAMREMKDNQYSIAIVDPPYGIGKSKYKKTSSVNRHRKNGIKLKRNNHKNKEWDDSIPDKEYFDELFRISENQIIWGGNYFSDFLFPTNGWIVWNKYNELETQSDGELAWTSYKKPLKILPLKHSGFRRGQTIGENSPVIYNVPHSGPMDIHPTQKPVKLYEWLLMNYAKEGDKILDTHFGSLSIGIACHNLGFDLDAYEIDNEYFQAGKKRLEQHQRQLTLFR